MLCSGLWCLNCAGLTKLALSGEGANLLSPFCLPQGLQNSGQSSQGRQDGHDPDSRPKLREHSGGVEKRVKQTIQHTSESMLSYSLLLVSDLLLWHVPMDSLLPSIGPRSKARTGEQG